MYYDVHAHLDLIKNLDNVMQKCQGKNISIIAQGVDTQSNRKVLGFIKKYGNVKAALGIYPSDALKLSNEEFQKEMKFITINKDNIVAIGEIGIDGGYKELSRQKELFIGQLKLAEKLGKTVIIHSRGAEEEAINILEKFKLNVVMHCFCGSKKLVNRILENKWFISIPANVVFNEQFQRNVRVFPIEQLLCETDSPFLHPVKGKRNNTPLNVVRSYMKIAAIKKLNISEVEKQLEENFKKLFG